VAVATISLPVLEYAPLTVAAQEPELFWVANHTQVVQPVCGGWLTVRMLIGSIDGDQWPWTRILVDADEIYRWVQVLGTPESMTVEIGGEDDAFRIGHARTPRGAPVVLPRECQWWVPIVWEHQSFTADEALLITREYLTNGGVSHHFDVELITSKKNRN
jgi:hypothetical protein